MYPILNLQQLMSMYRQQPLQFQQPIQQNTQQQGGGSGGGMNLSSMKNMYNQFAGGQSGGSPWGNMFGGQGAAARPEVGPFPDMGNPIRPNPLSPSYNLNMRPDLAAGGGSPAGYAGGEAAPLGLSGSYAGAAPAEGLSLFGGGGAGAGAAGEGLGAAGAGAAEGLGAAGAGAAEGVGAAGAGLMEGLGSLLALMFSDPRVKENKAPVGKLYDGTPVWSYNYIGDPTPRIGLMANEVRSDAVYDIGGVKAVDYHRATEDARAIGGILGDLGA